MKPIEKTVARLLSVFGDPKTPDPALFIEEFSKAMKGVDPLVLREAVRERIASVPDITEVRGSQIIVDRVERTGSVAYRFRDIFSSQPVEDET